ncbi:hypothetical protein H920_18740 [Fukomys damarensis]|uniref:Uncharacterized protein n=1 Tax=Fukomys damarensis TaxID=885580 RepID=A0A091CQE6_FUKDA|nr:hypothetical protein H920_18740 [Fukomys damarensis]
MSWLKWIRVAWAWKIHLRKVASSHEKRTGGEIHRLLIFSEKLAADRFPDANLAVVLSEAQSLAVPGNGCRSPQGSSDLHREHHFLAPLWILQPDGTNSSPQWCKFSGFHHWLLAFRVQILNMDKHENRCGLQTTGWTRGGHCLGL